MMLYNIGTEVLRNLSQQNFHESLKTYNFLKILYVQLEVEFLHVERQFVAGHRRFCEVQ